MNASFRAVFCQVFWERHDPTQKDRQGNDVGYVFCPLSRLLSRPYLAPTSPLPSPDVASYLTCRGLWISSDASGDPCISRLQSSPDPAP